MNQIASSQLIEYDYILISDLHFGSPICQAQELCTFLSSIRVQYLLLLGDVFDDLNFHRLQHWHWEALGRLRKMSDHCHVIWIRGNHDIIAAPTMSHLLGVQVRNNFSWTAYGKQFFAIHGDRWDTFIYKYQRLTTLLTWFYNRLTQLNSRVAIAFTRWLKARAKLLTRNSQSVQKGAVAYAHKKGYDLIFCGHTHMPSLVRVGPILYGNDGTWQSDDPHFIGIKNGSVDLYRYTNGTSTLVAQESF